MQIKLLFLLAFSYSFTFYSNSEIEVLEKVRAQYTKEQMLLKFDLTVKIEGQIVMRDEGELAKKGNYLYKRMNGITTISNGSELLVIDDRVKRITYTELDTKAPLNEPIIPELNDQSLKIVDALNKEKIILRQIVNSNGLDSTDYVISAQTYLLENVIHFSTEAGTSYISEITYDNSKLDSTPEQILFQFDEYIIGKKEKAMLTGAYNFKQYSLTNTFTSKHD